MPKVSNKTLISKEEREKLYKGLKMYRGSIKAISTSCKCTGEWVRLVLKGDFDDSKVLSKAVAYLSDMSEIEAANASRLRPTLDRIFQNYNV